MEMKSAEADQVVVAQTRTYQAVEPLARAFATAVEATARDGADPHATDRETRRAWRLASQRLSLAGPWLLDEDALTGLDEASGLLLALRRHRVKGLVLMPGASRYEVRAVIGKLASVPESGGLGASLKRLGVSHLWPLEWPSMTARYVDLLATSCAALEALRASPRLAAELVLVADAGLRALESLKEALLGRSEEK